MAIKHLSGNRVTALSTDLVSETTTEIGYTGSSQGHIDSIHYKRFSATAGQKISKIGVRIYSCTDTKFKGGVYTDNGASDGTGQTGTARPQTLLSQGEITGVTTSNANLWVEVDVDCTVPSDGLFWVGFISDDNSTNWYRGSDNTLASGGVYGSDCTPSGRQSNYANMMYSTANYGNGNNNQVAGNNTNMRYTISSPRLGTSDATVTHSNDFSSDNMVDQDSSKIGISNGSLDYTIVLDNSNDASSWDLGATLSDTAWVCRFKMTVSSLTQSDGTFVRGAFGLSSLPSSSNSQQSHDFIGLQTRVSNVYEERRYLDADGGAIDGDGEGTIAYGLASSQTTYVEMIRTGATSYTIQLFSDSDYSTQLANKVTGTCASTLTGLRYFGIWNDSSGTSSNQTAGTIDDVKIYNGVTSAASTDNAVTVPNGSVAEETDTGKHQIWNSTTSAWVEVG